MIGTTVWGLVAGAAAVGVEYLYRSMDRPYWHYLPVLVPVQLVISYSIYRLVTAPRTSLVDALIVFTFSTAVCRLFVSVVVLRDHLGWSTWVAFALVVAARVVQAAFGR